MKKTLALIMAFVMCLSLCACSGDKQTDSDNSETTTLSKDEMLSNAVALTREDVSKSIENIAFAKSLIGKTFTFGGEVFSVKEDHAVITFYIDDEEGAYATAANMMVANIYLPVDELIALENSQRISFVGVLEDVTTHDDTYPDSGTYTVTDMIFKNIAVISDRFEKTGTLDSPNASYGDNSWNIKFEGNNYLGLVYFRDDVSAYKGQEITYSYKVTSKGCVDAYIVE